MKGLNFILLFLFVSFPCFSKDDSKENKKIEKEERAFQKQVKKNPNASRIYWEHAKNLAGFKTLCRDAKTYYIIALQKDSVNALIYKDYGKYLLNTLYQPDSARIILAIGLKFARNDDEMKNYFNSANKVIEMREAENRMKDFGNTTLREIDSNINYARITNFDSLKSFLSDNNYKNNYQNLRDRFLADDELTPAEMYLLIVGYTKQDSYNPFTNYEINELRSNASHNIDSNIKMAIELVKTNPVNPSLNREIMYYYRKKNDTVSANRYLKRIQKFFYGILYSGNGSCSRPYISIWPKEEYNFITYLGYKRTDSYTMGSCAGQMVEILEVIYPNKEKHDAIHFNISLVYLYSTNKK